MNVIFRTAGRRATVLGIALSLSVLPALSAQDTAKVAAALRAGEARVQPGDRVVVKVYREAGLSDEVMVNPRGDIVLAKIGTVHAASFAIGALEDTLRTRYGAFLRDPEITITVLRRIVVIGEVRRPDIYFVDLSSTLRDVIARAGGITEIGNPAKVFIIREGVSIPAPHWQDDISRAADLQSGDQVFVGMRSWFERNAFAIASTGVLVASFILTLLKQ
ncbi:MAG TPA: polysaccharide biosynthesis/export family protein [Gemmatimonadaceae bacterium]|nr:polysaccharide biosynthesis/export family protein [Gemmatimonadaceae bacterium]